MPRYNFNVIDGKDIFDREGTELTDIRAARKEAVRHACALLDDGAALWSGHEWRMLVRDETGAEVLFLRFSAEQSRL